MNSDTDFAQGYEGMVEKNGDFLEINGENEDDLNGNEVNVEIV